MELETNMDPNSSAKQQKSNEDLDIISNLPDFIIGHILSLLSTRDAVRTCVLSKRWIYLWTFITKLHFNDREQYKYRNNISKTSFYNSVNRVLLHLNTSSIQSFSLSLSENYLPYHVNQWISVALCRRVKELFMDSTEKFDICSHSLWRSWSLEKLVLDMSVFVIRRTLNDAVRVRVPTFVCLSSLAVLKLSGITFTCVPSNDSQNLTLDLPVLREYETNSCTWLNVKDVTFEVPMLEVLSINHTRASASDGSHTMIKFCASRLTEFSYSGFMSEANMLDLSIARIAFADIFPHKCKEGRQEEEAFLAYKFLKKITHKVECLKFKQPQSGCSLSFVTLVLLPTAVLPGFPEFEMLSRLELDVVSGLTLLFLLTKAPFLRTLTFQELLSFGEGLAGLVPPCFTSKLQVVNFGRFKGNEHELCFAKFVIENTEVLNRASFTAARNLCGSQFEKVKEKIFSFKRSVSSAVIEFSSVL